MTTFARRPVAVLPALALCVVAAGCGSSGSTKTETVTVGATSTPTVTSSTTTEPVTTPAAATTPTPASTGGAGGSPTKPGTVLQLGQAGSILYDVVSTSGKTTHKALVSAKLVSVRKGSISDLKNFKLDAQTKQSVPFYVTATFQNRSKQVLKQSGLFGLMDIFNGAGDQAQSLGLLGEFPKCDGSIPDAFKPGASATECDVYVLPKGQSIAKVQFTSGADDGVSWKIG